jgi:hypothetical protein
MKRCLLAWSACFGFLAGPAIQAQDVGANGALPAQITVPAPSSMGLRPTTYPPVVSPSDQSSVLRFRPPAVDRSRFVPLPEEARIMSHVKIKYAVRADGYEFCSRITGIPIRFNSQPMACAFWNVKRRECTIVTPLQTGFNYIGHELRHCFEGAFHD